MNQVVGIRLPHDGSASSASSHTSSKAVYDGKEPTRMTKNHGESVQSIRNESNTERFGPLRKLVAIGALSTVALTGCATEQSRSSPSSSTEQIAEATPSESIEAPAGVDEVGTADRERPENIPDYFPDLPLPNAKSMSFHVMLDGYQVQALTKTPDETGLELVEDLVASGFTVVEEIDDPTGDLYLWYLEGPGWDLAVASRIDDLLYTISEID